MPLTGKRPKHAPFLLSEKLKHGDPGRTVSAIPSPHLTTFLVQLSLRSVRIEDASRLLDRLELLLLRSTLSDCETIERIMITSHSKLR